MSLAWRREQLDTEVKTESKSKWNTETNEPSSPVITPATKIKNRFANHGQASLFL